MDRNANGDQQHTHLLGVQESMQTGLKPSEVWARLSPQQRDEIANTLVSILLQLEQHPPSHPFENE